jgi:hypothetical protein
VFDEILLAMILATVLVRLGFGGQTICILWILLLIKFAQVQA